MKKIVLLLMLLLLMPLSSCGKNPEIEIEPLCREIYEFGDNNMDVFYSTNKQLELAAGDSIEYLLVADNLDDCNEITRDYYYAQAFLCINGNYKDPTQEYGMLETDNYTIEIVKSDSNTPIEQRKQMETIVFSRITVDLTYRVKITATKDISGYGLVLVIDHNVVA